MLLRNGFFEKDVKAPEWFSRPNTAIINISNKCNLECPFCYTNAHLDNRSTAISNKELESVFKILEKGGITSVQLTGGEPLLHPQITNVLKSARSHFQKVTLCTNGLLLNDSMLDLCEDYVDVLAVSLDGSTKELHEAHRGVRSFEPTIDSLNRACSRKKLEVRITQALTSVNIDDIDGMIDLSSKYGISIYRCIFMPQGRGSSNDHYRPSWVQLWKSHRRLLEYSISLNSDQLNNYLSTNINTSPFDPLSDLCDSCGAASSIIYINSDGSVYPCPFLTTTEFYLGNIIKEPKPLEELLRSKGAHIMREYKVDKKRSCTNCEVRYLCGGGCIARSLLERGSTDIQDPLCPFYQRVYKVMMNSRYTNSSIFDNIVAQLKQMDIIDGVL